MVNYVCRTCLYVCDNEFSFRKLEKVKPVLELFVPELRRCIGKYSLICEQCYYFLKNVEKFKVKCIETQKKLYTMNLETIRDNYDSLLKSALIEPPVEVSYPRLPPLYPCNLKYPVHQKKTDTPCQPKGAKRVRLLPPAATASSNNDITLTSILQSSAKPSPVDNSSKVVVVKISPRSTKESNATTVIYNSDNTNLSSTGPPSVGRPSGPIVLTISPPISDKINKITALCSSGTDDLLQLLEGGKDVSDGSSVKAPSNPDKETQEVCQANVGTQNLIMNYPDSGDGNDDNASSSEEDEYLTRKELVEAGILSDHCEGENEKKSSETDDEESEIVDIEIEEISSDDEGESRGRVEFKIASSEAQSKNRTNESNASSSTEITTVVKTEKLDEDENPGFFNKQSNDGFYKCKLCDKNYKTSQGLYKHTKNQHADLVRFHHCNYCSFFSLWKSALARHYSVFHENMFGKDNSTLFKCYHCDFQTKSKIQLSHHIRDVHIYECTFCKARFSDNTSFARHVQKEHLSLDMVTSSNYCPDCTVLFLTDEDYKNHMEENHDKVFCPSCDKMFGSNEELRDHQRTVHVTSFGASVLH